MIVMTVRELVEATGAELVCGSADTVFCGVSIDSRTVPEGAAFVAFGGERVNGNDFVAQALAAGAAVAVMTEPCGQDVCEVAGARGGCVVRAAQDDGEAFMLALAGAWRAKNPQWDVVGVTGSVGKTTTKDMLAAGIGATHAVHATKGNFNNLIGAPLTLLAAPAEAEVLVVEMGMNHLTEIERISRAAAPDVGIITNVGTSHIGYLGSRENIARAKAEILCGMRGQDGGVLVLASGDDYTGFIEREFAAPADVRVIEVGGPAGAVRAENVVLDAAGHASLELVFDDGLRLFGTLGLTGRAMVADLLSAMGAISAMGCDRAAAFEAICALTSGHMRMDVRQEGASARVIDDTYNASPASMAAALDMLCSMECEGRRIAVLGEMGELGDLSAHLHALVGSYAAAKPIDMLVAVGTEGAYDLLEAARTMGLSDDRIERFDTTDDAIRVLAGVFGPMDLVLCKGSRSAGLDRLVLEVLGI